MNEYSLDIRTDREIGRPDILRGLLTAWSQLHPSLKPEYFGLGEPISHSLATEGIDCAVNLSNSQGIGLMLRRQKEFKFVARIDWSRVADGQNSQDFPSVCKVWLQLKAGDKLAIMLFRFLVDWLEPTFARLSTDEQEDEKHFVQVKTPNSCIEAYVGLEIGTRFPGVYWITYFGSRAISKIGTEKFGAIPKASLERLHGGVLITAHSSSRDIGSSSARASIESIISLLGSSNFFDKTRFDKTSLLLDSETEAEVERKIEGIKGINLP